MCRSYFHKKNTGAYASQTDLLLIFIKKIRGADASQTDLLNLSVFYSELIDFQ